jgi:outer membrane protein TolC
MKQFVAGAVVTLVLLHAMPAPAQDNKPLTLQEAIVLGKENNKLLLASGAKVDAATARAGEARAALLPAVRMQAGYTRLSDVDPFRILLPISPTPVEIAPVVLDNFNFRVGVQQPLFTGFRLSSNARAADLLARASVSDRKSDQADLVLTVTSAYWTLYQTGQTKALVDENVTRLESYRKDTENLLKSGLATNNDRLRIEVQLANARLQQIDAVNDVQVATLQLNNHLGLPLETRTITASLPGTDGEQASPGVVSPASQSVVSRPDLQAMQTRVEASKEYVGVALGGWWPQVALAGNYYFARPNGRYQPLRDEFKSTWDVGVSLQWDVWTWLTPALQTEQAKAQLRQNELLFAQMCDNAEMDLTRARLAVDRARNKIAVAGTGVQQSEENVRTLRDKYRNGLATSTEILDADVAMLQARTNLMASRVELEVAFARLARAMGTGE